MITSNYQVDGDIYSYADKFFCDSSDDKPSNADAIEGLINGAILEETDTGKTYIFDKKANKWTEKSAGGGGGSSTLSGLTDVDISNPSDGQTLVFNATSGKWENGEGGRITELIGEYSIDPETDEENVTLNMTPDSLYALCPFVSIKFQYTTLGGSVAEKKLNFESVTKEIDQGDIFYFFAFAGGHISNAASGDDTVVIRVSA